MSDILVSLWGTFLENFWYLIVFAYGAIVGSFLNVLIYRMPLGMSVSKPPSHCPRCNTLLRFWDNIPLFAFLSLGGKCRYCRAPISWRYFGVELMTACLWTALYFHVADRSILSWVDFLAQALFVSVLVAVIFIDLDHFIIPDELNWFGIALGVVRDIGCLALAWKFGGSLLPDAVQKYGFLGLSWLPRSLPGALAYGAALYLVSFVGWIVYARVEGESLASVARRFPTMEDPPELPASELAEASTPNLDADVEEDEAEGKAVRLQFSPAFLSLVSALVLLPVIHTWAALFFAVPFVAFVVLSRLPGEPVTEAANRFFRSNDQGTPDPEQSVPLTPPVVKSEPMPLLPGDERLRDGVVVLESEETAPGLSSDALAAQMRAESDQFAIEAESGSVGGMGLGDVKLALAIGAILGPGLAFLSLFLATFVGAVTGITVARINGRSLRLPLPFGPFMALGAIIVMLYGTDILTWYFGTFMPQPVPLPQMPR